ncbi:L,D-transpeptidase [Ammoniphilus oxalaticus]|uniref:L,D-transpeptidase n=1 Tax=Ammoniphilus oxalaticus TaxID=66863 RepID=UPI000E712475|nr:L,D-transpeptidase [Ammoniphilus oxalaticus]
MKRLLLILAAFCLFVSGTGSAVATSPKSNQFIIINKANNRLAFYEDGKLVKSFSVATGKEQLFTPEGTFQIVNKIKNRPYYTKNIPGGDPRNPLGDRWLGLNARGTWGTTYAIHGNANPNSIGRYVSEGCVRMHNQEVRWLFDQVKLYTPVVITTSKLGFEEIAVMQGLLSPPIEKVDTMITLLSPAKLYTRPYALGYTGQSISPQQVQAFEKAGSDWYRIKAWFGDAWFKAEQAIVGGPKIEKVDTSITILDAKRLYAQPQGKGWTGQTLSPQRVTAFEKAGDWYRIKAWFGNAWLDTSEQAIVGGPQIKKVDTALTLTQSAKLYKQPFGLGDTGQSVSPQRVLAFEKAGDDWYRIKTWVGDAWLHASEHTIIGDIQPSESDAEIDGFDPVSPEVLREPDVIGDTELDRKQVPFEIITADQMDQAMTNWYNSLIAAKQATSGNWRGELYIFLPAGYLQEVIEEDGKLVVTGTAPDTSRAEAALPLLLKLPGFAVDQTVLIQ